MGTFAVQIARRSARGVTGVCRTRNVDLVRSLGADNVIDYTQADFARSERRYDVVLDMVGNRSAAALPAGARPPRDSGPRPAAGCPDARGTMFGPMRLIDARPDALPFVAPAGGRARRQARPGRTWPNCRNSWRRGGLGL